MLKTFFIKVTPGYFMLVVLFGIIVFGMMSQRAPLPQTTPTAQAPIPTATATPSGDIYQNLTDHFEKVTTLALGLVSSIVAILSVGAVIAGFYSIKTIRELQQFVDKSKWEAEALKVSLRQEIATSQASLVSSQKDYLEKSLNEIYLATQTATNRLEYILGARDSDPAIRRRSVQKMGYIDDIYAKSLLIQILIRDENPDVRTEAAFGLKEFLTRNYKDSQMFDEGINALLQGTKDSDKHVRIESITALDDLALRDIVLPRIVDRRLEEIVKNDIVEDVRRAAQEALDHIKQQREGKFKPNSPTSN